MAVQVDGWAALVPNRGNLVEKIREDVADRVRKRGIERLDVAEGKLGVGSTLQAIFGEKRHHVFFTQRLGVAAVITLALRIEKRGENDLELSWRLLEGNPLKSVLGGLGQAASFLLGFVILGVGVVTSFFGFGLCIVPVGLWIMGLSAGWWVGGFRKSKLNSQQMIDSRALAQTVDYCLMESIKAYGIKETELRLMRASQMSEVGGFPT